MIPFILIAIILVLLIYISYLAISLYLEASRQLAEPPQTEVFYRTFNQIAEFNQGKTSFEDQSESWKEQMRQCGRLLSEAGLGLTIFSHGTFVGEDPFGVSLALESLFPFFNARESARIKAFNRSFWSQYLYDKAYFQPKYVKLFEDGLQQNIPALNFSWSSGNHHAARLFGAIRLLKMLDSKKELLTNKRALLIGHSHAGQLFALVAHLISESETGLALKKLMMKEGIFLSHDLAELKDIAIDFVLLGSPYLYDWPDPSPYRVVHFINHRNHPYLAGHPTGALHTRDGDYIQQWGAAGSDFIASTAKERLLNTKLSEILGDTTDRLAWKDRVLSRLRVPPYGKTYLIDYKDNNQITPNWMSTIFGHGIYTEYQVMLFNTHLICEALYDSKD
jgi:hypothetical protein